MLGWPEIVLILVILLLIFGPSKMPEIARTLGEAFREFKKASEELQKTVEGPIPQTTSQANIPQTSPPQVTPQTTPPQVNIPKSKEDENLIIQLAKKLGIATEGKDIQTIMNEIEEKAKINKDESKG
jgi:TatA/E family protein of Tat protein translocase